VLFENGILKFDSGVQSLPDHSIAQKRVDDFLLLMTLDSTCVSTLKLIFIRNRSTYGCKIDINSSRRLLKISAFNFCHCNVRHVRSLTIVILSLYVIILPARTQKSQRAAVAAWG